MMMTFVQCWKWRSSGSGNGICRVIGPSISEIGGVKHGEAYVLATAKEMRGKEQGTAKKLQGPRGG